MSKKAVLILEDAVFIRQIEKKFLKSLDYEISGETSSASEGVQLYRDKRPDLVIVDLTLAEGSGQSAIKSILEINPDACIVVVTSNSELLDQEPGLRTRVASVILKPFSEEEFLSRIKELQ
jgi:two-component system, chemotaxis family, chemotaxis protein CheY